MSGVLAKLIDQTAVVVTGARSLLGALFLLVFIWLGKRSAWPQKKARPVLFISGVLLALHWIAFYQSVKVASVSIAVITVSTFPVMTSIIEPLVLKTKWRWPLLISPVVVCIGTWMLLGDSASEADIEGMYWGFSAAFIYVIIHLINKVHIEDLDGVKLSFIQLAVAGIVLIPTTLMGYDMSLDADGMDIPYILILSLFCTSIAYSLFIGSMKKISASLAAILCGLEPVYGIFIDVIFLNEVFRLNMIFGAALILASVIWSSVQGDEPELSSDTNLKNVSDKHVK